MSTLTNLELTVLQALVAESASNGHDFGLLEAVKWENRQQLGGVITQLQNKGFITEMDEVEVNGGPSRGGQRYTQYVLSPEAITLASTPAADQYIPPQDIIEAAAKVGRWFKSNNVEHWALGPCASRSSYDLMLQALRDISNNPDISSSTLAGIAAKAVSQVTGDVDTSQLYQHQIDAINVLKLSGNMRTIDLDASGKAIDRTQLFKDTLTTAVEGGIGYWCSAGRIERDDQGHVTKVHDAYDAEDKADKFGDITLDTVRLGFERIVHGDIKISPQIKSWIVNDWAKNDSVAMDAEAADCIVQVGLFNEIVYG